MVPPFRVSDKNQGQNHKGIGVGYLITMGGKTIYHAGYTDFIPEMMEFGDVDVALLPIGGTFTMDIQEAVDYETLYGIVKIGIISILEA